MKQCNHCGCEFATKRENQKYCTDPSCRRQRKNEWQKNKLKTDPDYRVAQKKAQKHWYLSHQDYWQRYREKNPQYTEHNRYLQRIRNKRRSKKSDPFESMIAKMDTKPFLLSGTYYIFLLNGISKDLIAKMDTKLFQIQPVIKE